MQAATMTELTSHAFQTKRRTVAQVRSSRVESAFSSVILITPMMKALQWGKVISGLMEEGRE